MSAPQHWSRKLQQRSAGDHAPLPTSESCWKNRMLCSIALTLSLRLFTVISVLTKTRGRTSSLLELNNDLFQCDQGGDNVIRVLRLALSCWARACFDITDTKLRREDGIRKRNKNQSGPTSPVGVTVVVFVGVTRTECVKAKICNLQHETTVHHAVGWFQVAVTVNDAAVKVCHSLKKNASGQVLLPVKLVLFPFMQA